MKKFLLDKNNIFVKKLKHTVSFPSHAHENLISIENNSFWFKHRNEIIKKIINRFPFEGDLVDIGGGNGYQLVELAKINSKNKNILIEPGYVGCLTAKKRGVDLVYNSIFQEVDFNQFKIRGVTLFDVIEHIDNDINFLQELLVKLHKGTRLYITLPAHNFLWSDVDSYGGHYRRYNKIMIEELTSKLDVKLVYFTYFFSFLLPISYILRALPYKLGLRKNETQISNTEIQQHNPEGLIRTLFSFFEKRELQKINTSSISVGASCLVVLEKK